MRVKPRYQFAPFNEKLIALLQRVADGEMKRLMVFMPPRHGKSELVSRLFPAYFLYRYPEKFVGLTSYAANLAYTLSRNARANFLLGGGALSLESKAVQHWETSAKGGMWAGGVGGPATGKGMDLGIVDDPVKDADEAKSETVRERNKDWWDSVFSTRQQDDNCALIVLQTRWHEDDLSGWLLDREKTSDDENAHKEHWHIVSMPAIAEDPQQFPDSCTVEPDEREIGQALWPERVSLNYLQKQEAKSEYWFGALFQQRPRAKEGSFFKVANLNFIEAEPNNLRPICRGWDLAASTQGDYTVGVKMGMDSERNVYVLDCVRGQWLTDERNKQMRLVANTDGRKVRIRIPQDPGQAGVDQVQALTRMLSGFTVKGERPSGDKETRADSFASQVNAGNVYLVRGDWNKAFIEELRSFPLGKNDDQVDAASDAFTEVTRGGVGVHI